MHSAARFVHLASTPWDMYVLAPISLLLVLIQYGMGSAWNRHAAREVLELVTVKRVCVELLSERAYLSHMA